jgi:hypothetical protein
MIRVIPMPKPRTRRAEPRRSARARKVAVSLPAPLLDEVERRRRATGDSRSGFVGKALEHLLRSLRAADGASLVREYVEGYRRLPETEPEIAEAEATAGEAFGEEAWE